MARSLSLHHLSMMELTPIELIKTAAAAQFEHACVFVQGPPTEQGVAFPLVTKSNAGEMRRVLADTGVTLYNLELFFLTPETDVESFRPALELGKELGGVRATAFGVDPDDNRLTENFARFCELTSQLEIKAGLEFMKFLVVQTFDHAMRIIRGAGHPNGTLALDPIHLIRNGSSPADLAKIGPDMIGYVQFCDGPLAAPEDEFYEAVHNRMAPGEGAFPLQQILDCIHPDRCLSLEAPMEKRREAGMDALARAKLLNRATREVLSVRG